MKRCVLILSGFLLATLPFYKKSIAQTTSSVKQSTLDPKLKKGIRGKVKEMEETNIVNGKTTKNVFRFDEKGNPILLKLVSYNGNVSRDIELAYDSTGKLIKRVYKQTTKSDDPKLLGALNEISEISINEEPFFNKNLNLSSRMGGDGEETSTYEYHPNGKEKKCTVKAGTSTTILEYNTKGTLVKLTTKDPSGTQESRYNESGKQVSYKVDGKDMPLEDYEGEDYMEPVPKYDTYGRIISSSGDIGRMKYTYNPKNFLASINSSNRWEGDASEVYSAYVYDEQNNWTKRSVKKTGERFGKTGHTIASTRVITYY